jgi:hypothetical protein
MAAETLVALIAAGATVVGAFIAWLSAHRIEKLKGDIAKDSAAHESSLHVNAERQMQMFRLATDDIQKAAVCLVDWRDALKDYSIETTTKGGDAWPTTGPKMTEIARAAEKVGLLLPPELDAPYIAALNALNEGTKGVSGHSILLGLNYADEEAIHKHFRGKEAANEAVQAFLRAARVWKTREWPLGKTADVGDRSEGEAPKVRVESASLAEEEEEEEEEEEQLQDGAAATPTRGRQ